MVGRPSVAKLLQTKRAKTRPITTASPTLSTWYTKSPIPIRNQRHRRKRRNLRRRTIIGSLPPWLRCRHHRHRLTGSSRICNFAFLPFFDVPTLGNAIRASNQFGEVDKLDDFWSPHHKFLLEVLLTMAHYPLTLVSKRFTGTSRQAAVEPSRNAVLLGTGALREQGAVVVGGKS